MKAEILRIDNLRVNFGKEKVYDTTINLFKGEILALVGLNDSGRSAVVKVLAGIYPADRGMLYIENKEIPLDSISSLNKREIFCIFEKTQLIPNLTISENMFVIKRNSLRKIKINEKALNLQTVEMLKRIGCSLNPETLAENLTKAEEHLVLIAKALSINAKIIVIDGIIGSYTKQEVDTLKKVLLNLSEKGISIIFACSQFENMMEICHRMMLFREGTIVKTLYQGEYSKKKISAYLVGYAFFDTFQKTKINSCEEILTVRSLFTDDGLEDINFHLNKGEVLGFLDLEGTNGNELIEALFSTQRRFFGSIKFKGKEINFNNYREALKCGIGLIPENGLIGSVFYNMSISENIIFMKFKKISKFSIINSKLAKFVLKEFGNLLNMKISSSKVKMKDLSKYDLQRIIMYRWLLMKPEILIMIKPSRDTDVVTRKEIYSVIDNMRKKGVGIIIVSTDASEILSMSDRILVLSSGSVIHEFTNGASAHEELRKLIE
ncbi:ATP-binding cassette domain-containing protein [Clostridium sp. SYSU_GA19001]|uniref:ATP-binding cassette domain-containing protein n=1 Tax=Clostridium caldaquaticum TaxID=2940653 RepID=UPI002076DBAC|nr:ATP-binding cassette domain-containing protein [Clostridium caldaquaticum]MCM8710314.1 ATP-binding cassette domain-containing protein [Clostridium caldaquaticum]